MVKAVEKDRSGQFAKCGGGCATWTTLGRGREMSGSYRLKYKNRFVKVWRDYTARVKVLRYLKPTLTAP
jgi:hypothetical protein